MGAAALAETNGGGPGKQPQSTASNVNKQRWRIGHTDFFHSIDAHRHSSISRGTPQLLGSPETGKLPSQNQLGGNLVNQASLKGKGINRKAGHFGMLCKPL